MLNKTINPQNGLNIEITFTGCNSRIIIQNYNYDVNYLFVFSDGTILNLFDYFPSIEINTLNEFEDALNDMNGNYILMADIDLNNELWTPIGTTATPFYGKIDGNGHKISNIEIDLPTQDYIGFFGVNSGIITNLQLENVTIKGRDYVGGFVGRNNGKIINCSIIGGSGITGRNYTGGFVGINYGIIKQSYTTLNVLASDYVGGFVGYVNNSRIEQCYATGNINSAGAGNSSYGRSGGFAGYISSATVRNCFSTGKVIGRYLSETAGFVWGVASSIVTNCYSLSNNQNGFVQSGTVVNSYFDKELIGINITKEQGRTTNEMQTQSTFVNWDFIDIWEMTDGEYPILRGFLKPVAEYVTLTIINDSEMSIEIESNSQNNDHFMLGETVTLKILPSDEWIFKEWQDEDGNSISTDEEYTFIITSDIVLNLVCEAIEGSRELEELEEELIDEPKEYLEPTTESQVENIELINELEDDINPNIEQENNIVYFNIEKNNLKSIA